MTKCGLGLLVGLLLTATPAWADRGARGGAHDDDGVRAARARVAQVDDDDDDDDRPARAKKRAAADDDDDADADDDADVDDDADDGRASRRSKWRKRTDTPTADDADDDDDDDDDHDARDDDDDRPARKRPAKTTKRTTRDEDDDAGADDDDDDDDRPARKRTTKAKKRTTADDDDADDDRRASRRGADDDDDDADGDDADTHDDDGARKPRSKRRVHARRAADDDDDDDTAVDTSDDDDAPIGAPTGVIEEVYIIPPKVIVAAELLGAAPIDSVNSDLFASGAGIGVGAEYYLSPALALHGNASFLYFRAGDAMSTTSYTSVAAGPRLHVGAKLFGAATHHDAWLDAHATYGSSGGIRRPGFDLGGAVQWEVSPAFRMGPMVRWAFGSDPLDRNAQVITVGLALGVGGRTRQTIHVEGDADGDGLIDRLDECPGELPGAKADPGHPGCPVRDADDDGIPDDDDECADEPAGERPDLDRIGCPLPPIEDADGDGVPDDADACPDKPGVARHGEPTNGCPLAQVKDQKIEILEQIFFEHDSATISEQSQPVLEAIGSVIAGLGDARISIEGHTDEVGTDAYNMDLSKRRARAVAQWLIENAGIAAPRLEVKGWGKRRPLVSGAGADTSKNRRVEFLILGSGAK